MVSSALENTQQWPARTRSSSPGLSLTVNKSSARALSELGAGIDGIPYLDIKFFSEAVFPNGKLHESIGSDQGPRAFGFRLAVSQLDNADPLFSNPESPAILQILLPEIGNVIAETIDR